jgi:pimeloyl-ACP methyl ester carboxylesterase
VFDEDVHVAVDSVAVCGRLTVPERSCGLVLFVHGSGSGRHSPRNRYVASALNRAGIATLLFDLLTPEEEFDRTNVFDIDLLTRRLRSVANWVKVQPQCAGLPMAFFGASTGAGAALRAAADPVLNVAAVGSRGGRPDLAGPALRQVRAPTLLIVGGNDPITVELNQRAQARIQGVCELTIVPGATHLFEEPGALQKVSQLARDWFIRRFQQPGL